jgi:putative SOS response-associated peptidase YedK
MCGRINVSDHAGVQALLDYLDIPFYQNEFQVRFNIAPGATLFTAYQQNKQNRGNGMVWGIVPPWAKPEQFTRPLINARSETVWEKPSFRSLMKSQRAIVPINGFYEWKREKTRKTPYHIHSRDQSALALGALYQITKEGIMQCCIVTTSANESMEAVHDRMPVILSKETMSDWLYSEDKIQLDLLMQACPDQWIQLDQVSSFVSNAKNEGVKCTEPVQDSGEIKQLF